MMIILIIMSIILIGFVAYSLIDIRIESKIMEMETDMSFRILEQKQELRRELREQSYEQNQRIEKRIGILEMLHNRELSEIRIQDRVDKPPKKYNRYIGD